MPSSRTYVYCVKKKKENTMKVAFSINLLTSIRMEKRNLNVSFAVMF